MLHVPPGLPTERPRRKNKGILLALSAVSRKFLTLPRLPVVARALALALLVGVVGALGTYLYLHQSPAPVRPDDPVLKGTVKMVSQNFRHLETEGGKDRYLLTAAVYEVYENGAHKLSQVELLSFGAEGNRTDRIVSDECVYEQAKALVVFEKNVRVATTDGLQLEADVLRYNQETGVVEVEDLVKYKRPNLEGTCRGAIVETNDERLRMLRDVDMTFHSADDQPATQGSTAAAPAAGEKKAGKKGGKGGKGGKKGKGGGKKKRAAAAQAGAAPAAPAVDFANGPRIPVRIRSGAAVFDKKALVANYEGNVVVTRASDEMRAASMVGRLTDENRIRKIEARGSAYLKAAGRAEATAPSMDFLFAEANQLERAVGTGGARLNWLGEPPAREVTGERVEIDMQPGEQGSEMRHATADGQAVVTMAAPAATAGQPNPAARELRADQVRLDMLPGGQFARRVEAEGNAVFTVTPVKAEPGADRKRITAPRMKLAFYDEGNLAREFTAEGGVKVDFEPLAPGREARTTTSESARADFERESQDVARVEQAGEFKYVEGERNGTSGRAVYTRVDDTIALRGESSNGRPTVWDSKARTQANEIDIRSAAGTSQAREDVRTTYYSPESTGNSVPFGGTRSPVFLTAERLDTRQSDGGVAVYAGAARAWQDDNYVRADAIRLFNTGRRMEAEGNVESGLYRVARKGEDGKSEVVPVFTTAARMRYSDADRTVRYEGGVTSRQAPDVLTSQTQDVWLSQGGQGQVERMVAEGDVLLTEPGRKATGNRLVYTASDQKCVLTGNNARVEDVAEGTSTGAELTFYIGGDRIRTVGQGAGRVKTTHRIRGRESQ
jgi:lipopolysaccharide export system protein LptA